MELIERLPTIFVVVCFPKAENLFLFNDHNYIAYVSEIACHSMFANWFGSDNRGFIMGLWGSCQPLGNICGSLFTALIIPYGFEYTFFFIALMLFVGAIVVMLSIDPSPSTMNQSELEETRRIRSRSEQRRPISIGKAFLLPGVLAANRLSIWYDIGGIASSVAGGYLSDKMGCRAPVIFVMLISSIGSLLLYILAGSNKIWNAFMMAVVGVTVSGPYYLIVGAISIDLGSQPALSSNKQAMSTVSGLLDGTGSAGSAIGQMFIPYVQKAFGWSSIFYYLWL
ncbi:hypothetical protein DICVIV_04769 [Dictyocaulus viviparus]|uniref:Major facilitator superfamily (MFS) profile domain-containing protein n=1 Tax=Dictyocaulus viviparus TaxID=29172 RepID=A0A0D8XZE0_DICVI|nr:hypothetical protein DICVIV_04769 [Dictyocaulus viviparus]